MTIAVGSKVKDKVTGFSGLAVSRTEELYATPMVRVIASNFDGDGKPVEVWLDEPRLEVTSGPEGT